MSPDVLIPTVPAVIAAVYAGLTYHQQVRQDQDVAWNVDRLESGRHCLRNLGPGIAYDVEVDLEGLEGSLLGMPFEATHEEVAPGAVIDLGALAPPSDWVPQRKVGVRFRRAGFFGRRGKPDVYRSLV